MSNRRFEMFTLRQILVRMRQGDSDRDIARSGLMGRKKLGALRRDATAQGWLDSQQPLPVDAVLASVLQRRVPATTQASSVAAFKTQITQWAAEGIQGTTIHAALVRHHGFTGSYSAVKRAIRHWAPPSPPKATMRLVFAPGEAAQVDFGAGPELADPTTGELRKTWFFVMTLCWSRHQYAEIVWDQKVLTWLACHRHAFQHFGGIVQRVIIDNAKCAITKACINDPAVQRAYAECAEGYGFRIDPCPPHDPAKKGIVESGVKFIKRSFLPLRTFHDRHDANRQLHEWIVLVGNRVHGTTQVRPLHQFAAVEKALLQTLPDTPVQLSEWSQPKVHRDAHVQYAKGYYSVPYHLIGQRLWLRATDTTIRVYHEHALIATHPRLTQPGTFSTVTDHLPPEGQAWQSHDLQWCLRMAQAIGPHCHGVVHQLFVDRVLVNLRAAQNLLRLREKYTPERLEVACARALRYGTPRYGAIAQILKRGLDQEPLSNDPIQRETSSVYTRRDGRFLRDPSKLFH
ncbi:IS21 family transposase [Acidithiobacillus sp. IBUN Pt1247-S3]|uniref:IS21 family transposase n=1 Tax=Acidithiobacillus sp. IBUN Pt1247-S3 TaxID=3166642 RepID=UPI0034E51331